MEDDVRFERRNLRREIHERLEQFRARMERRPLTVALIGTVGVGKSSFINSVACAMSTRAWREHSFVGHHGNRAEPVTAFTRSYPQCCRDFEHNDPKIPTLLDIGGLPDQLDARWTEVVKMVLYGRVPVGTNLLDVYDYLVERDRGDCHLPPRFLKTYSDIVVDRVVVVAAATEEVPENLLETVVAAARPLQGPSVRSVPVFGVITKIDLVDPEVDQEYQRREKVFKDILGLHGAENRFCRCINYCGDIDPDNNRIRTHYPNLDVPILRLMTQICDPTLEVVNPNPWYPFYTLYKERSFQLLLFFMIFIIFLLPLLVLK